MKQQTARTILRTVREAINKRLKKPDEKLKSQSSANFDYCNVELNDGEFVTLGNEAAEFYLKMLDGDATVH